MKKYILDSTEWLAFLTRCWIVLFILTAVKFFYDGLTPQTLWDSFVSPLVSSTGFSLKVLPVLTLTAPTPSLVTVTEYLGLVLIIWFAKIGFSNTAGEGGGGGEHH